MRLKDWADQQGISYVTAWRWFKTGKLPLPATKTPTGMILVHPQENTQFPSVTAIYCRVSSNEKKEDLKRQVERVVAFVILKVGQ